MTETNTNKNSTAIASLVERLVIREYSQGVCNDGATILCDGTPMTVEDILARLKTLEDVRIIIHESPEFNTSNYTHDDVCLLNLLVSEAWNTIERNV